MWIRLKIEGVWVSVVRVYASTEDCSVSSKDEFFLRLQETVGRVARDDLLIVMGDMNARVGDDTTIWGEVFARHGEEVCNENGRRFCSSAVNTAFGYPTPDSHTKEYTSTRGNVEAKGSGLSLTMYLLVGKEARKKVIDVKAVRGAEIGSDLYLVLMKIKLKVRNVKKSRQEWVRQQIKVGKLKDDKVRREYQAVIAELLEEARARGRTSGTDVELAWKELKEGIVGAAMKVCGTTKKRKGETKE